MKEDDRYVKNRRVQLKKWFEVHPIPVKEKSYISQLIGGTASFGAKAARRLENDYGMGEYYLERHEDAAQATKLSAVPDPILSDLAILPAHEAEVWRIRIHAAADERRIQLRAAQEAGQQQERDRRAEIKPRDPHLERRRAQQ